MFKSVTFYGSFGNQTGYQFHATQFCNALEKLIPVKRNQLGSEVSISLIDSVSIQNTNSRLAHKFNILYNVWESTLQPQWFMDRLKFFDQLWVPSEAQREWSILQGIPEEFVKVVPEGINPDVFKPVKPIKSADTFNFLHIGQWQPRKSTLEICQSFLKAFPDNPNVRLYLAAETKFPSDQYKTTQERLESYHVNDKRIIPLAFDEHLSDEKLLKLFAKTDCFVSCSRSEGWGMPICLAMACGIPTIAATWGGSTEYASPNSAAYCVQVPGREKPHGIYGDWDVPGEWGSPDYSDLVRAYQTLYADHKHWKKVAIEDSNRIRTQFSWDAAANKAYSVLEDIHKSFSLDPEQEIKAFARDRGYEVTNLRKSKAIFVVDCYPNSQDKMNTLIETIGQIQGMGYPVLVTSHYPLPQSVLEKADYYLYEQRDIMSGDDKPIYHRTGTDGQIEQKQCTLEYQGVAAINCFRNAIDFCKNRYDWIYQMCADIEVDLDDWLNKVYVAKKPMVCIPYEGRQDGIGGGLWAGKSEVLDKVIPYLDSWKEYAEKYPDVRFVVERWLFNHVSSIVDINDAIDWIQIETHNRFDNVDRSLWDDDVFQVNYHDGPGLTISGMSNREYNVVFGTPAHPNVYNVNQKPGMWSRADIKFYQDWVIKAYHDGELKFEKTIDLKGTNVLISMGSKALGDTIAWIPYIEEFRKKHECHVVASTWWNKLFDYPEIEFVHPGTPVQNVMAMYTVGCFDDQPTRNPVNWRDTPLQKVSADILGLDYKPIRAKLNVPDKDVASDIQGASYVCFSEHSTMQNKLWNRPGAWQNIVDYLNSLGYIPVSISAEATGLRNVIKHNGQAIEDTVVDIANCAFYIGLNHGPIWLAYALDKPAIMITGVSEPWNDFENHYRVSTDVCRPGCFNDRSVPIDRSWNWCPRGKDFICTGSITEEMVMEKIDLINEELGNASDKKTVAER